MCESGKICPSSYPAELCTSVEEKEGSLSVHDGVMMILTVSVNVN